MENNTQLNVRGREDGSLTNKMLSRVGRVLLTGSLMLSGTALTAPVFAEEVIEEQVVTGVRGKPRTVQDSPVPIDVFNEQAINDVAFTDMNDILRTLVPSYGVRRQPISDGATFIRPATMRGLPTDKTLVLVNSKRRHRAALVSIGGSGTQGPDLATIPASAIKSIEILRDGASALYGSDAIAGVMNFILKDNNEGGMITFDTGQYYAGDGQSFTISGNLGMPLGSNGFLSVSAEKSTADSTYRGSQYCGSWFCLDPNGAAYDSFVENGRDDRKSYGLDPDFIELAKSASYDGGGPDQVVQPWGNPNHEATRLFFNAGLDLTDSLELYAFGNYSDSEGDGSFFYRYPYNGTIEKLREQDGSVYFPLEKFPGGFTPRFFSDITDYSILAGIKSTADSGFGYDLSARFGDSTVEYTLKNTINPSMGPDSPTSFRPGDLTNQEMQLQADFFYGLTDTISLVFGASYLDETYKVVQGELSSYFAGPYATPDPWGFCDDDGAATAAGLAVIASGSTLDCADSSDPVYRVVGVGSNGFPGYSPAFSEEYNRDSVGFYAELGVDLSEDLFVQAALRYEDYSDFGSETVYKVAGRYSFSETFGLRTSYNTGFRAPTPGQQGTTNVSTRLPNGFPVATGLFPAGGPVAQALGAKVLMPETSENFSIGVTGSIGDVDFTLDYFSIDVADYFSAISTLDVSTDPTSGDAYQNYLALDAAGVSGANSIGGVFYFANAYDRGVSGWDLVATYPYEWDGGATTTLSVTVNSSETEFQSDASAYLNAEDRYDTVNFDPNTRWILSASHYFDAFTVVGRASYWGEASNYQSGNVQEFDSLMMLDLEISYAGDGYMLAFGGRNLLDEYPDKDAISDFCCGRDYPSASGISWQGGYYYLKMRRDF
jgi:iron complex outermembrane receptor protein